MDRSGRAIWNRVAKSFDTNLGHTETVELWKSASWTDASFPTFQKVFRDILNSCPILIDIGQYDWVLDRKSFDYASEPLYQIVILQVIAGLIKQQDDLPIHRDFGNLSARFLSSHRLEEASPFAFKTTGWKFVAIPYGWEDITNFSIAGLLEFYDLSESFCLSALSDHDESYWSWMAETGYKRSEPYWRSIALKAILSEMDLEDAEVWDRFGSFSRLAETEGYAFENGHDIPNRDTVSHLGFGATSFAVAHEVAHHLMIEDGCRGPQQTEELADRLAYAGLWNCEGALGALKPICSDYNNATFASGLFFYLSLFMAHYTERASQVTALGQPRISVDLLRERFKAWWLITDELGSSAPNVDATAFRAIHMLLPLMVSYIDQYSHWVEREYPALMARADRFRSISSDLR